MALPLPYACWPQKVEERLGEKVNREQEIMVVLAEGDGRDGDNCGARKKMSYLPWLVPSLRNMIFCYFFSY